MPRLPGRTALIQIETSPGAGTFVNVGSLRTNSLSVNNRPVDVSNKDTAQGFTEWDTATSIKEMTVSGEGIIDDGSAGYAELVRLAQSQDPAALMRYTRGTGFGLYEGPFVIESLTEDAPHDGPVTYSLSLRNKGDITFTP